MNTKLSLLRVLTRFSLAVCAALLAACSFEPKVDYLDPPAALTFTALASQSISVEWTPAENADYYILYRSSATDREEFLLGGGTEDEWAQGEAGWRHTAYREKSLAYTDKWLTPDTVYYYKTRAFHNSGVFSGFSAIAETRTLAKVSSSDGLEDIINNLLGNALIDLASDLDAPSAIILNIPSGRNVTLDGGGKTIHRASDNDAVIVKQGGGSLSLINLIIDGAHNGDSSLLKVAEGTLTLGVGSFVKDNVSSTGGGVDVDSGAAFILSGGTISGNTSDYGGGVYIDTGASFTMTSGTISGNTSGIGGGVHNNGASFTMRGGTISDNASDMGGGGVHLDNSASFTMIGGIISDNEVDEDIEDGGGGVYIEGGSSFTMTIGTISGNTSAFGGGVHNNGASFTMSGGTISGNSGAFGGGGVFLTNSVARFTMSGGTIIGNEVDAGADGGGVYVEAGVFTMDSPAIAGASGNIKENSGGNVYKEIGGTINGNAVAESHQNGW